MRKQLLADARAVRQAKDAHPADLVAPSAPLDVAPRHSRMPKRVAIEVAQDRPHVLDRRRDDRRATNFDPQRGKGAFSALRPAANTFCPMCWTSVSSLSGAASNSALHSAKA